MKIPIYPPGSASRREMLLGTMQCEHRLPDPEGDMPQTTLANPKPSPPLCSHPLPAELASIPYRHESRGYSSLSQQRQL